ncbi:MAG: hypothetical protein HYV28_09545 [Ignavibacteriales bacterium]|nr:hypothetical protein [Ignavibacteriales bacterium]
MDITKKFKWKYLLPVLGGVLGYSYYYFIGCTSGKCAITSDPYISTIYGTVMASVFLYPDKKKAHKDGTDI